MSQERIEVITSVQRRRRFTVEQKMRLVEESNRPGMSVSHVARNHGVAPSQLFHWRRRMAEGSREAVSADDEVVSAAEVRDLRRQVRELQRVLGKKTMENEILREAVQLAHENKTDIAFAVAATGRFAMKTIAETFDVSRSNLIERIERRNQSDRGAYAKADDEWLLPLIREIVDRRPTYGY